MLVDGKEISVVLDEDDCVGCVVLKFKVSSVSTFSTFQRSLVLGTLVEKKVAKFLT
jgi:hypothetical protein